MKRGNTSRGKFTVLSERLSRSRRSWLEAVAIRGAIACDGGGGGGRGATLGCGTVGGG